LYRTAFKDRARAEAALESWYGMVPRNWENTVRYVDGLVSRFADRTRALQVLDTWTSKNPGDSAKAAAFRRTL
jgi:hypothetical protein